MRTPSGMSRVRGSLYQETSSMAYWGSPILPPWNWWKRFQREESLSLALYSLQCSADLAAMFWAVSPRYCCLALPAAPWGP
jgi:hypothetical protein